MRLSHNTMKAWALDARLKTSLEIPTDLDAVAEVLGVAIVESADLPNDVLGMHITHPDGHAIVAVKPSLSHGCRRFTIAHELCHHLILRAQATRHCSLGAIAEYRIDRLCNQFAADILMPAADLHLHAPHFTYGLHPKQLQALCDLFETTPASMQLRLRELRIPEWWWAEQDSINAVSVADGQK